MTIFLLDIPQFAFAADVEVPSQSRTTAQQGGSTSACAADDALCRASTSSRRGGVSGPGGYNMFRLDDQMFRSNDRTTKSGASSATGVAR